jgi:hypothetical protein
MKYHYFHCFFYLFGKAMSGLRSAILELRSKTRSMNKSLRRQCQAGLKAEVEKGFARTAFDRESVDPEAQINLVNKTIGPVWG